jgi:hypothetical protein
MTTGRECGLRDDDGRSPSQARKRKLNKTPKMRSSISAVFLPLIAYPVLGFPRMKAVCTQIVSGKWGLGFHALPICRSRD